MRPGGRGREPVVGLGAVEADQGVEVDEAAQLVLGDLRVLHRRRGPPSRDSGTPRAWRGRGAGRW